jgi:hypothetical protein
MLLEKISQKEIQVWTTKVKRVVCLQQLPILLVTDSYMYLFIIK